METQSFWIRFFAFCGIRLVIHKGTSRAVWVFPDHLFVLKFPIIEFRFFFTELVSKLKKGKTMSRCSRLKRFFFVSSDVQHSAPNYLFKGWLDNLREFKFSLRHPSEGFVCPTYFSFFGLVNIARAAEQLPETRKDCVTIWGAIIRIVGKNDAFRDNHHLANSSNFGFIDDKVIMLDYGSTVTQEIILKYTAGLNRLSRQSLS